VDQAANLRETLEGHFVGRQAELALLGARLDQARSGHPCIVLIEGPPGIGRTALVDRFVRASSDVQVLRASGDESESDLTYGVVEQLVRFAGPAGSTALASKERQAAKIEDQVTVGARVLDLLGGLQEQDPVVLVVDDAHWADLPSLRALLFGLRRLVADQVLALIVARDEQAPALPEGLRRLVRDQGATVRLGGLDAEDLRALAEAMGIEAVSSRAAQRLHAHTLGNPLHARALRRAAATVPSLLQHAGAAPLRDLLPRGAAPGRSRLRAWAAVLPCDGGPPGVRGRPAAGA
jgi:predicted ATPase